MATSSEQKYHILRKRLNQFGYKQPLAIESLPLVEKLFQDLIHTTEALKKAKDVCFFTVRMKGRRRLLLYDLESSSIRCSACLVVEHQWQCIGFLLIRSSLQE